MTSFRTWWVAAAVLLCACGAGADPAQTALDPSHVLAAAHRAGGCDDDSLARVDRELRSAAAYPRLRVRLIEHRWELRRQRLALDARVTELLLRRERADGDGQRVREATLALDALTDGAYSRLLAAVGDEAQRRAVGYRDPQDED